MAYTYDLDEIADLIERFISGQADTWEWDDFESIILSSDELEDVRKRIIAVSKDCPSLTPTQWCSDAGMAKLKEIAISLRARRQTR